jgi:hypothetical protein
MCFDLQLTLKSSLFCNKMFYEQRQKQALPQLRIILQTSVDSVERVVWTSGFKLATGESIFFTKA